MIYLFLNCCRSAECKVKKHDTAGLGLSLKANQVICFSSKKRGGVAFLIKRIEGGGGVAEKKTEKVT